MDQTLIIGLGNPDPILENTYHNIGVLCVDWLAEYMSKDGALPKFKSHKGLFSYAKVGEKIFIRPLVFMNESGKAIKEAMRVFDVAPSHIVVIHDDSDITIGDIKFSTGGRAAGHKGIQSIIDHTKTDEFARVRIGIREKNEVHRKKAGEFVLSTITSKDQKVFQEVFEKISERFLKP